MSELLYNLSQLEELAGGSQEFVESMVDTFLEHTPQQVIDLRAAFDANDMDSLGKLGHKIKPNIDLFGITSLHEAIRVIEHNGKHGVNDPVLEKSLNTVETVLNETFNQLRDR